MTRKLKHFDLHEIKPGVFSLVNRADGWGIANSGLIDLGGILVVFDSSMTPNAAQDIVLAANDVSNRPVDFVINSHYHNDHIGAIKYFHRKLKSLLRKLLKG